MQVLVLALSVTSGHIVAALLNLAGVGLLARRYQTGKLQLDSVELWKLLPEAKKFTYCRLGAYGVAFAFTMFRCACCCLVPCSVSTCCGSWYHLQRLALGILHGHSFHSSRTCVHHAIGCDALALAAPILNANQTCALQDNRNGGA